MQKVARMPPDKKFKADIIVKYMFLCDFERSLSVHNTDCYKCHLFVFCVHKSTIFCVTIKNRYMPLAFTSRTKIEIQCLVKP